MRFEHAPASPSDVLDVRPFGKSWIELKRDGTLARSPLDLSGLDLGGPIELHVARDLRHVAVVERFGRKGRAFRDGKVTMELDRGGYRNDLSVFPVAFLDQKGRSLLVHATDWNRLDVSAPSTGELLSGRETIPYQKGEPLDPRYLNYFYGALHISPDDRRIATDGWRWHPFGEVRSWSLDAWISNLWESENGPSVRSLTYREDWNQPLCWIDDGTIAVWGIGGYDEDEKSSGIWTFNSESLEKRLLLDPGFSPHRPWPPKTGRQGWMVFDGGLLFAIDPSTGTTVWTLAGERLHFEAGFAPRRYHPDRREFSSWEDGKIWASRLVP